MAKITLRLLAPEIEAVNNLKIKDAFYVGNYFWIERLSKTRFGITYDDSENIVEFEDPSKEIELTVE